MTAKVEPPQLHALARREAENDEREEPIPDLHALVRQYANLSLQLTRRLPALEEEAIASREHNAVTTRQISVLMRTTSDIQVRIEDIALVIKAPKRTMSGSMIAVSVPPEELRIRATSARESGHHLEMHISEATRIEGIMREQQAAERGAKEALVALYEEQERQDKKRLIEEERAEKKAKASREKLAIILTSVGIALTTLFYLIGHFTK